MPDQHGDTFVVHLPPHLVVLRSIRKIVQLLVRHAVLHRLIYPFAILEIISGWKTSMLTLPAERDPRQLVLHVLPRCILRHGVPEPVRQPLSGNTVAFMHTNVIGLSGIPSYMNVLTAVRGNVDATGPE